MKICNYLFYNILRTNMTGEIHFCRVSFRQRAHIEPVVKKYVRVKTLSRYEGCIPVKTPTEMLTSVGRCGDAANLELERLLRPSVACRCHSCEDCHEAAGTQQSRRRSDHFLHTIVPSGTQPPGWSDKALTPP